MAARPLAFTLIALFVLAPSLAVVLISALLLFGVHPHLVFLPGHLARSVLEAAGLHPHNRVGVIITFLCAWVVIVLAWLALRQIPSGRGRRA